MVERHYDIILFYMHANHIYRHITFYFRSLIWICYLGVIYIPKILVAICCSYKTSYCMDHIVHMIFSRSKYRLCLFSLVVFLWLCYIQNGVIQFWLNQCNGQTYIQMKSNEKFMVMIKWKLKVKCGSLNAWVPPSASASGPVALISTRVSNASCRLESDFPRSDCCNQRPRSASETKVKFKFFARFFSE